MHAATPIETEYTNTKLKGYDDIPDLPIVKLEGAICSTWKFNFWDRLLILFTGQVHLHALGNTHPPVALLSKIEFITQD